MKKFILTVALAATSLFAAQAQEVGSTATAYQYVSPITVSCMEFNTTAMRDSAVNHEAYLAHLAALQKQVQAEKTAIDAAVKNLKLEKDLYSEQAAQAKDRKKLFEGTVKDMQNDIKAYESQLKSLKKQYNLIKKMDDPSCEAIRNHSKHIDELEKKYEQEKKRLEEFTEKLSKNAGNEINNNFTLVSDFLRELTDKETRLKNIQAQNKTNLNIIKQAIKAANGK